MPFRDTDEQPTSGARDEQADAPAADALYGPSLEPGAQVGNYVVEERRARGGFATIYRARHVTLGRRVALKILHPALCASMSMLKRFEREAQTVNRIRHPNIVDVFEIGELSDGRPYFVMEWLDGRDLGRELEARGALPPAEALAIFEDLGAALAAAHAHGVVHRDLKASNVLLVPAGEFAHVKLVDFGIAKLLDANVAGAASTGLRFGTPWNMAPEQIRGEPVDARADIYAAGVLLYQVLTGELPFRGAAPVEVHALHLHAPPPRASALAAVPPAVDAVVARCLEKSPDQRFPTVEALLRALRRAILEPDAEARLAREADGLAVYVEARLPEAALDEATLDRLDDVVAAARADLASGGFGIAVEAPNAVLGVRLADSGDGDARAAALERALGLRDRLHRAGGVEVAVALHVAAVLVRGSGGAERFVGGELLRAGEWTARAAAGEVIASARVVAGLEARFALEPAAQDLSPYFRIKRYT